MRLTIVVLMAALTACSSGSTSDTNPVHTSTPRPSPTVDQETALRAAVQTYSMAFLSGDGATAYAMLSKRCRARLALSDFAAETEQAKTQYGPLTIKSLDVTVNGAQAQATYTYKDHTIDQTREPWVRESGQWHEDDC